MHRVVVWQWRHSVDRLTPDRHGFAAGGEHAQRIATLQQRVDERRTRCKKMLAIVEHQDHVGRLELLDERRLDGSADEFGLPECQCNRLSHLLRLDQVRQVDKRHIMDFASLDSRGDLHRQARLADAAWSSQRNESCCLDQLAQLRNLFLAADEAGQRPADPPSSEWTSSGLVAVSASLACCRPDSWCALSQQFGLLPRVEPQDLGESLDRVTVRAWAQAALEIADTADAEPCPLCKFQLGEAGSHAMPPQQFAKRQPSVRRHPEPRAAS
jgi:hypothetical protein